MVDVSVNGASFLQFSAKMDDFGDSFVQPEVDPAAEFLAREQNQLAGLEDDLETSAPPPVVTSAANGLDDFVGKQFTSQI